MMKKVLASLVLAGILSTGCGDTPVNNNNTNTNQNTNINENANTNSNNNRRPYTVIPVHNPTTITGRVLYTLPPPPPRETHAEGDPACPHKVTIDILVVSAEGGLKNAVISLEGINEGKAPREKEVMFNRGCVYSPHVLALSIETKVDFVNDDNTLHNVHGFYERTTVFNNALVNKGMKVTKTFPKQGIYKMKCDVHPWMLGWIIAKEHPYVAVTDDAGMFALTEVPPGNYTLSVWHENKEWSKKTTVSCEGGKNTTTSFSFP